MHDVTLVWCYDIDDAEMQISLVTFARVAFLDVRLFKVKILKYESSCLFM